jgi:hypothetical protein
MDGGAFDLIAMMEEGIDGPLRVTENAIAPLICRGS